MSLIRRKKEYDEPVKSQEVIVYPEGVVDEEAYKNYLGYKKRTENPKYRFVDTSDEEIVVDLATPINIIEKKIQYLPADEKTLILSQAKAFKSIVGKANMWKMRAFRIPKGQVREAQILDIRSSEIFEMFARMYSIDEIHRIINQEWEIPIQKGSLEAFRRIHLMEIREKQIEKNKSWDGVRLGWKRSRLEELSVLYEDRKSKYLNSRRTEDYKLLLQTIEQIRKEVEGEKITIDGDITNRVEEVINRHIHQEILSKMNIFQLILSRVAFTQKKNPLFLLYKLQSSYYRKYTGFGGKIEESEPVSLPSQLIYDFDEIGRRVGEVEHEEVVQQEQFQKEKGVTALEKKEMDDFQKKLIDKIRRLKSDISQAQFDIDREEANRSMKERVRSEKEMNKLVKLHMNKNRPNLD